MKEYRMKEGERLLCTEEEDVAEVWIQMKLDGEEKTLRQKYNEGWGKEKYSANRMRE